MFARIFFSIFLAASGFLALAPVSVAQAQPRYDRRSDAQGGVQPLDRLLPGIRRSHPGEFYDAEEPANWPAEVAVRLVVAAIVGAIPLLIARRRKRRSN